MSLFLYLKFCFFQVSLKGPFSRISSITSFIFWHKRVFTSFSLWKLVFFFNILSLNLWWKLLVLLIKTWRLDLLWFYNFRKIHHFALTSRNRIEIIICVFIWTFTKIFYVLSLFFSRILCCCSWFRLVLFACLFFEILFHCICTENFSFRGLVLWNWIASIWWIKSLFTWPVIYSWFFVCASFNTNTFTLTCTLFFKCVSIIWFSMLISIFPIFWLAQTLWISNAVFYFTDFFWGWFKRIFLVFFIIFRIDHILVH